MNVVNEVNIRRGRFRDGFRINKWIAKYNLEMREMNKVSLINKGQ